MPVRKRPRNRHSAEKTDSASWLTTFNDLMTLLLTFFVLLLAMGSMDSGKAKRLYSEFRDSLGALGEGVTEEIEVFRPMVPVLKAGKQPKTVERLYRSDEEQANSAGDDALRKEEIPSNTVTKRIADSSGGKSEGKKEGADHEGRVPPSPPNTADLLKSGAQALQDVNPGLIFEIRQDGSVSIMVPQVLLFDSGEVDVKEEGVPIIERIGRFVATIKGLNVVVEGHTDDLPIHTLRFPSNWELSIGRAMGVMEILHKVSGLPREMFSVAGYADSRPVASNRTEEGREENRRVEILLTYNM